MEATALYPFDASQGDELSFRQGDVLKVRNKEDLNWYHAELNGKMGFIPAAYVQMAEHGWYKGGMSRQEAEVYLLNKPKTGGKLCPDGAFIVRDCQTEKDQFSLSVKHGSSLQHFKILYNAQMGAYYLWPDKTFPSINKLIEHHRTVSVSREHNSRIFLRDNIEEEEEYEALYDFTPESAEEVAFRKGDRIKIIEKSDPNWWTGEVKGAKVKGQYPCGFLPSNYIRKAKS